MARQDLTQTELGGADLTGATFKDVKLDLAKMQGATLNSATFKNCSCVDKDGIEQPLTAKMLGELAPEHGITADNVTVGTANPLMDPVQQAIAMASPGMQRAVEQGAIYGVTIHAAIHGQEPPGAKPSDLQQNVLTQADPGRFSVADAGQAGMGELAASAGVDQAAREAAGLQV